MQSKATTVEHYLAELPPDRRVALQAVRDVILKNLDQDYEEGMQNGMIGYFVPHLVFPAGYHCDPKQPLPFAALASQKNYMSLYLMSIYGNGAEEKWLRAAWAKTGKKLNMGKCCIRFKRLDDLPLEVIAEAFRRVPARSYVAQYQTLLLKLKGKPRSSSKTPSSKAAKTGKPLKTKKRVTASKAQRKK